MDELPITANNDIIPYAQLNKTIWYFSGINFVKSAALLVPFEIDIEVEVRRLVVCNMLLLLSDIEDAIEFI